MENKSKFQLTKTDRLKSRKAIELLFEKGKSFSLFPFKVIYYHQKNLTKENVENRLQTAFSVSKKYFKKAVERNRIKRLMREAYRLQKTELKEKVLNNNSKLDVFLLYTGNEIPEYDLVFSKINALLKRLQKILNETGVTNS